MMKYRKCSWSVLFLLMPCLLQAQVKDTLADIKAFMRVCNTYKQMPLQLDASVWRTANIAIADMDTASVGLVCYIQEHGSYLKFAEVEQVANDSLVLMINHKVKQIMAMPSGNTVAKQLLQCISMPMADSAITRIASQYKAAVLPAWGDTAALEMVNRKCLPGTSIAKEVITARYHKASEQLIEVRQLKRTLFEIAEVEYQKLQADSAWSGRLFTWEGHYLLVKEVTQIFHYNRVSHDNNQALPLRVSDCVTRLTSGKLQPAAAYDGYQINENKR